MSDSGGTGGLQKWENTGASFRLSDGREVGAGDVFEASATDPDVVRRRHKLRPAGSWAEVTVPDVSEDTEDADPGEPEPDPDDGEAPARFPGIDFGSDVAYELARDALPPLSVEDLRDHQGSGQDGALLKSDVQAILDEREG